MDWLDEILAEYFTWRGEAIHLINQTANYQRMKQAIEARIATERREARFEEHKTIMANLGAEYARAVNAHPELNLDPDLFLRAIKERQAQLSPTKQEEL